MWPNARVSRGRLGLGDGHALTRTIPGARSGGVSERGQEDENQAAERSPETHAAEPQGADWQAGASARVASREEARAPNANNTWRAFGRSIGTRTRRRKPGC